MKQAIVALAIAAATPAMLFAQGRGGRGAAARGEGKAGAIEDLTGYWVSVVTEDYRWRMFTPLKGDAASVPINNEGRKIVDAWDPAKDEAAGLQCRSYGAAGIMRVPGGLHISWEDEMTLKIETDADRKST